SKVREAANRVTCASNLRQNGISLTMYASENQGWYPLSDWRAATLMRMSAIGAFPDIYMDGRVVFKRYGFNLKTLTCPSGSWEARYWLDQNPLAINYYYNGGVADWPGVPPAVFDWYGHYFAAAISPTLFQNKSTTNEQPVPRRQMIKIQDDTALMT